MRVLFDFFINIARWAWGKIHLSFSTMRSPFELFISWELHQQPKKALTLSSKNSDGEAYTALE